MSETDDTDVLLLIPPDFFLVHSSASDDSLLESSRTVVHKPKSCTAQVLGKLVDQVHSLESRLESLELSSSVTDTASVSVVTLPRRNHWDTDSVTSRERAYFTFPRRRRRKSKKDWSSDISFTSYTGSSKRNIPPLKLNFEEGSIHSKCTEVNKSPSMDGDLSSIVSTPSKKNDKLLLHEIDEFLTKVESYESPDSKYRAQESISPENVIKATGDYIAQKIDNNNSDASKPARKSGPNEILDKYIYLVKNNPETSSQTDGPSLSSDCRAKQNVDYNKNTPENSKATQSTKRIQEIKSPSFRRLNFAESKDIQPTSTPKKGATYTADTFKPSSNKIYDRATKVLEQYKAQGHRNTYQSMTDSYLTREDFKLPQMRPYVPENSQERKLEARLMDSVDTELLSLSELWGEKQGGGDRAESLKLEEERFKREHCEALIQQLQKKLLDQQEKIAVAVKVDRAKDTALTKLREAWIRLTGSLDRAEERHRAALEKMMREMENFKLVAEEAQKKTNHFETELYKALDLAHDYQEKCKQLTLNMRQLEETTEKSLSAKDDIIKSKEKEIEVLKENYETVMRLNKQSTDCVRKLEEALEQAEKQPQSITYSSDAEKQPGMDASVLSSAEQQISEQQEKSEHNMTKERLSSLTKDMESLSDEVSLIKQERDLQKGKVNEERARGNMLERQLSEKQEQVSELMKRCDSLDNEAKTIRKHLELQKSELKSHYQKQLEEAVMGKLQEFQQQLDAAEREMEKDARGKETAIVETFTKQISSLEHQHKLEINLLEEKQREEIKLYRLQLAQATEKIGLLESKLDSYRRRRGEIASQLHGVMEAQWRQALAILTSANGHDPARSDIVTPVTDYAAPKLSSFTLNESRAKRSSHTDRPVSTDLNFDALSDSELQNYVKMLLKKPPNLECSASSVEPQKSQEEPTSDRPDKTKRPSVAGKPPWKA